MKYIFILMFLLFLAGFRASAQASETTGAGNLSGHLKYRLDYQLFPADSLYREALGSSALDQYLETRLKFAASRERWDFNADYQFIAIHADTLPLAEALPGSPMPVNRVISDDRRWWDLTYRAGGDGRTAFVHRLDRVSIGYTTERTAWRFGRQAISWGNGLLFTPMDVFNPFDPAAPDKEYKTGDDMLYGQYLLAGGDDLQAVAVVRRDPRSGRVEADQSSLAIKYHALLEAKEIDLLFAEHYGDQLFGVGGNVDLGGAVGRADVTMTRGELEDVWSAVTSISYSWTWGGRNVTGLVEYHHNGFGLSGGGYSLADLARNPELAARIERGEIYTLGRNYLGASATVELSPLFLLTPSLFLNLDDPSALTQLVAQYSLAQDLALLCALNLPIGPPGSEYGGIETPVAGRYLSQGASLFAQLAWYF